jgi:hypothetical protein
MYQCDAAPPCTTDAACSGHGTCSNVTGACLCDEGFTGSTAYFSYRDCHNDLATQAGLTVVTIALAVIAGASAAVLFCLTACRNPEAKKPSRGGKQGQSAARRKLLLFIYARMVVASVVSIAYESLLLVAGATPLRIYEQPSVAGVLRALFPWLVIGNASYITDTVVKLIPLNFLKKEKQMTTVVTQASGRESSSSLSSLTHIDFDAVRNQALASFTHGYWIYDAILFVLFSVLAILMQFPSTCGCWCSNVLEISIGASCLPIVYFLSNSVFVLLNLLLGGKRGKKEEEGGDENEDDVMDCCTRMCRAFSIALGIGTARSLWFRKVDDQGGSKVQLDKKRKVLFKLKIIHTVGMGAAWGAFIVCMCLGVWGEMLKNSSIWVTFTMWFAHLFNTLILVGISGNTCASKRARAAYASSK